MASSSAVVVAKPLTAPIVKKPQAIKVMVNPIYASAQNLMVSGVCKEDWTDDCLVSRGGITMVSLKVPEIITLGTDLMEGLLGGISERDVGNILILAWNLISPITQQRVFPKVDPLDGIMSANISILSNLKIGPGGQVSKLIYPPVDFDIATAMCYIAASLLRLFTKTAENYEKAWTHIESSYMKFYKVAFPILGLRPCRASIDTIVMYLTTKPIFRDSLASILYCFYDLPADKGLCRMLFEQHLACTGLHSFSLFVRSATSLRMESRELLSCLDHRMTRGALKVILVLLNDFEVSPSPNRNRHTWKYSRIYDEEAFSLLQTKNCKELTCILAHICINAGVQGTGNILDIAQLAGMAQSSKDLFKKIADRITRLATEGPDATFGNTLFENLNN
ncbi:TPA_asm: nucleocapsid protein [Treubia virus 1]|uniref:Nucleoprotein n=1 Tax=Treubia virus 1 TaxID=2977996 RepID=A0A9N7AB54_9RHAB|nr:TPA_asm: nucleocapsid protein [Treubia virus 1]